MRRPWSDAECHGVSYEWLVLDGEDGTGCRRIARGQEHDDQPTSGKPLSTSYIMYAADKLLLVTLGFGFRCNIYMHCIERCGSRRGPASDEVEAAAIGGIHAKGRRACQPLACDAHPCVLKGLRSWGVQSCPGAGGVIVGVNVGTASVSMHAASVWSDRQRQPQPPPQCYHKAKPPSSSVWMVLSHAAARGPDCEHSMAGAGGGRHGNNSIS